MNRLDRDADARLKTRTARKRIQPSGMMNLARRGSSKETSVTIPMGVITVLKNDLRETLSWIRHSHHIVSTFKMLEIKEQI